MYSLEYLPIARRDMVDIAKYIGIKLANPDAADYDGDGNVTANDAAAILKKIVSGK